MWYSDPMPLYERSSDGFIKSVNQDAVRSLLQMVTLEPAERSLEEQRPYDAQKADLASVKKYIASVGEEQLPQFKPGQFEYPANSVYY